VPLTSEGTGRTRLEEPPRLDSSTEESLRSSVSARSSWSR
jgi:hypothetical protein